MKTFKFYRDNQSFTIFSLFLILSLCSQRPKIIMRRGYLKVESLKKWKTNKCALSFANNLWLTLKQLECVMGRRAKDLEVSTGEWDKDPGAKTAIGDIFWAMSEHVKGLCSWLCHSQWVSMGLCTKNMRKFWFHVGVCEWLFNLV